MQNTNDTTGLPMIEFLGTEGKVGVNLADAQDKTALHEAAGYGQTGVLKQLVNRNGANPKAVDAYGQSVVFWAAYNGKWDITEWLLNNNHATLKPIEKNNSGETALHGAVRFFESDAALLVQFLIGKLGKKGVDCKCGAGNTALHIATNWRAHPNIKYLINQGNADVNLANARCQTALHTAARMGDLEIVKFLVTEGKADVNLADAEGTTALHIAARTGDLEIVKVLVAKGKAKVNLADAEGTTALHIAAAKCNLQMTKILVTEGKADVSVLGKVHLYQLLRRPDTRQNMIQCLVESKSASQEVAERIRAAAGDMKRFTQHAQRHCDQFLQNVGRNTNKTI